VNPVALRTRKEKKWRIHPAASAGADANGTKEPQLHSPVCAGCEQFASKGPPLAQSWMEVPLMGIDLTDVLYQSD
jgi:hypothetical protein